MILNILKVFGLASFTFFTGIFLTPFLAHYLYKHKMWKKSARTKAWIKGDADIFNKLHKEKEINTPRMGGMIIWFSVLVAVFLFWALAKIFPSEIFIKLNFLSRSQTWLLLFTLIAASIIGLADDVLQVFGKGKYIAGGMGLKKRILLVILIGAIGAYWFYFKLDVNSVFVPFFGEFYIGWIFIPFFILVMLASFSGGVIDGLDGLSGGVMAAIFASYGGIAFFQNQIDIAAFCAVLVGGILAFLWFNIPPARFYMGETGILGLTATLTVVAFLTNAVLLLPVIAFPLVITSASVIIQWFSRRLFNKKIFLITPIHHHFEAKGWPSYKVTMRYWIIGIIFAVIGMIIALIGGA
jgi:phospho-N-acetylmuramoyl-pentapeptide-transferase